jgi:hypothetical protein
VQTVTVYFPSGAQVFNVGAARALHGGHVVQYGIAGQCDLYGLVRGGHHIECELKSARGVLNPEQESWMNWCIAWGVPHLVLKAVKGESIDQTVSRWCEELGGVVRTVRGG